MATLTVYDGSPQLKQVFIDDEDFERLKKHSWRLKVKGPKKKGQIVAHIRLAGTNEIKTFALSRMVLGATTGDRVDYINGDIWDCRSQNLKLTKLKTKDLA